MRAAARLLAAALLLPAMPAMAPGASPLVEARAAAQAPGAPGATSDNRFRCERLNRTYRDVVSELVPVENDLLSVRLSSPRNTMTVRRHLLRLEPGVGGSHAAELAVEIQGSGRLVAEVDLAGFARQLQDEVTVPPQSKTIEGRLRLARVRGGYLLTPEQLPRRVTVRIKSRLGADIVDLCQRVAILPGTASSCDGLERAFSTAVVPLPPAGEGFLLADGELTAQEKAGLDRYLAGHLAGYLAAAAPPQRSSRR